MFCSNCGKEIDENVKFCSNCGAKIGTVNVKKDNNNNVKKEKKEKKKFNKKIIIIVGIVIALIIGIICFINRPHIYEIGETAEIDNFKFTLLDVQYGDKISKDENSENYRLPISNLEDTNIKHHKADAGNTYCVITYEVEFVGKENTYMDAEKDGEDVSQFWLVSNDGYKIVDKDRDPRGSSLYRNGTTKIKNGVDGPLWEYFSDWTFEPFGDIKKVKLREYIEVPKEAIEKSDDLILVKSIYRASGLSGIVQYKLK